MSSALSRFVSAVQRRAAGAAGDQRLRLLLDLFPAAAQRRHQHRLDDQLDVGAAGVVGAKLCPLARVQAALEQRAEDRRLHAGPVEHAGALQCREILGRKRQHRVVGEEAAIEVRNLPDAEAAARRHRRKQLAELAAKIGGAAL